ncbi:TM0106 family RecB-like putative nuclease [bacterium]|nr:TM0106 family RecB-like putative nuclease [bacterium]
MQFVDNEHVFSPSDLVSHLACEHLTQLNRLVSIRELAAPSDDRSEVQLIRDLGDKHEQHYLEELRAQGLTIAEIDDACSSAELPQRHVDTVEAMRGGADVIFQATFFDGRWRGHADFLLRTSEAPSAEGVHRYEPYDTKLARTEKVSALVQLADYAHHLEAIQGSRPERVHIVLGDNRVSSFKMHDLAGFHRRARERVVDAVANQPSTYPDPVEHCSVCRWHERCTAQRVGDDHLVQIAGVGRTQIKALRSVGITTASQLASATQTAKPTRMQPETWDRIRRQAELQKRTGDTPAFELFDPDLHQTGGLRLLPEPSTGDLFFDIEGDPYRGHESAGLEYLWGVSDTVDQFRAWWAHHADAEQDAFEGCVDLFMRALEADPAMHIYHYAAYEVTVLKRLASRFGSRIEEVDHLLRNGVLIDLYAVARHAVRISAGRLSIKDLEAFYREKRVTDVQSGMESVVQYEAWLSSSPDVAERDQTVLDDIEAYNTDDCISTRQLRDWLEVRRADVEAQGTQLTRPSVGDKQLDADQIERNEYVAEIRRRLTADHDPADRESHASWLLGNLLEFHSRETKPEWWRHFAQIAMSPAELWEDSEAVADLVVVGEVGAIKQSVLTELRFDPEQPHKLKSGSKAMIDWMPDDAEKRRSINIHRVDVVAGSLIVKQGKRSTAPMPRHLISTTPVNTKSLEQAILEVGNSWLRGPNRSSFPAVHDLLVRSAPLTRSGRNLREVGETVSDAVVRVAADLDNSCLAVQGPPGTGKTYTGGRMIRSLVAQGLTVGVVSNSHRAVENLLEEFAERDTIRTLKVGGDEDNQPAGVDHESQSSKAAERFLDGDYDVVGGTAWFFSRPELRQQFDVLVVDEAGQFSLANTVASATAAKNLVLLGDPQQLDQPIQGTHPDGAAVSALSHIIGSEDRTVTDDQGIFLDDTWRMDAAVCEFVSDAFYDGRLKRAAEAPLRHIDGLVAGTWWAPVEHADNRARSTEEAERAAYIANQLVGLSFTDGDEPARPLRPDDLMFITPFNAQVGAIQSALRERGIEGAQVGTVDLFQGRQAPVVIYSLTSSSAELAPRGINFLLSANRFNVAISRAQVAAIVLGNPALLDTNCTKPEQLPLVGALLNYVDGAGVLPS